jgi:hypothetical protein
MYVGGHNLSEAKSVSSPIPAYYSLLSHIIWMQWNDNQNTKACRHRLMFDCES